MVRGDKVRQRERVCEIRTSDSIDLTAGHLERRLKRQVLFLCVFLLVRLMEMGGSIFFKPKYFFWDCWGVRTKSGYGCGQSREARLDLLVITKITQDVLPTSYSVHTRLVVVYTISRGFPRRFEFDIVTRQLLFI